MARPQQRQLVHRLCKNGPPPGYTPGRRKCGGPLNQEEQIRTARELVAWAETELLTAAISSLLPNSCWRALAHCLITIAMNEGVPHDSGGATPPALLPRAHQAGKTAIPSNRYHKSHPSAVDYSLNSLSFTRFQVFQKPISFSPIPVTDLPFVNRTPQPRPTVPNPSGPSLNKALWKASCWSTAIRICRWR